MCSAVGLPVRDLRRIRMGPIGLGRLKPGQWRDLTTDEVRRLKPSVGERVSLKTPGKPVKKSAMNDAIDPGMVVRISYVAGVKIE